MESIFYFILYGISAIYMQNRQFHSKYLVKNTCQETDIITYILLMFVLIFIIYGSHRERTSKLAVKDIRKHLLTSN